MLDLDYPAMLLQRSCILNSPCAGSRASSDEDAEDHAEVDSLRSRPMYAHHSLVEASSIMEVKKPCCAVEGARGRQEVRMVKAVYSIKKGTGQGPCGVFTRTDIMQHVVWRAPMSKL